jgi:DNA-binding transcriptional LysR family regulator
MDMMPDMRRPHLSSVDLNLLPALAALLDERSVTRAARTVGLSQSAMSRALARLRRLLADELLVREPDGYRLTPAAVQLRAQLDEVLPRLHAMFLDREYRPAAATREFRLAGSDHALAVAGPPISAAVLAAAPRASLRFLPWHSGIGADLADGRIDLLLTGTRPDHPITGEPLFTDETVCLVDREHPLAHRSALTLEQYVAARHLVVDVLDGTQPSIDGVLAARGTPRRAALTLPFHSTAPAALAGTGLVLSFPARLAAGLPPGLRVLRAPAEIRPLPQFLCWHTRQEHNKGHQWLRGRVLSAVRDAVG